VPRMQPRHVHCPIRTALSASVEPTQCLHSSAALALLSSTTRSCIWKKRVGRTVFFPHCFATLTKHHVPSFKKSVATKNQKRAFVLILNSVTQQTEAAYTRCAVRVPVAQLRAISWGYVLL
jgi:hypothetical protein